MMNEMIAPLKEPTVHKPLSDDMKKRLLAAVDVERTAELLRKSVFPGGGFQLRVRRAFPWSKSTGGSVEYEIIPTGEDEPTKVIYAQLRPEGRSRFENPICVGSSPVSPDERDLFFRGVQAITFPGSGMTLSMFPLDSRLPGLGEVLKPGFVAGPFESRLGEALNAEIVSIRETPELLGYRFGKRCTLRYSLAVRDRESGEEREIGVIGKMYSGRRGRAVFDNLEQLWNWLIELSTARPHFIPRPLCYLPEHGVYFQQALAGCTLFQVENGRLRNHLSSRSGALISRFHRSGLVVERTFFPEDEVVLLEKWLDYLLIVQPELKGMAADAFARIQRQAGCPGIRDFEPVVTHRDFFDKQVVVGAEGLSLIDLDTAAMSDPAIDIGNFAAHIFLRAIQYDRSRREMADESDAFVTAYLGENPGIEKERIAFYTATTLFRLTCLYSYRTRWQHLSSTLLEECRQQLGRL